jgi:hypothetical protein
LRRFLRSYRFEIIWLAIIVLGIFLIFEQLNIRRSFVAWLGEVAAVIQNGVGGLGGAASASLAQATLSDTIGYMLILVASVAIALRVRWRLMRNPALTVLRCPQCAGTIHRVHRRAIDRVISLYVPVRRYRCANNQCRWHGLRVGTGHGASRVSARGSS